MVGLGETSDELVEVFRDLRQVDCQILTVGQYLRPSLAHLPMARYYTPDEFRELKRIALDLGFGHVESGPLVRSSYHAHEQAESYARGSEDSGVPRFRGSESSGGCRFVQVRSARRNRGTPEPSGTPGTT